MGGDITRRAGGAEGRGLPAERKSARRYAKGDGPSRAPRWRGQKTGGGFPALQRKRRLQRAGGKSCGLVARAREGMEKGVQERRRHLKKYYKLCVPTLTHAGIKR